MKLANEELEDARRVLKKKNLNPSARTEIKKAIRYDDDAIASVDPLMRQEALNSALNLAIQGKDSLGTVLEFEMGEDNLVFLYPESGRWREPQKRGRPLKLNDDSPFVQDPFRLIAEVIEPPRPSYLGRS
ncbi:MAG: hypothetical protein GTN74_06585 [Proteobacteria bacterium]|nr:hypothetical protein [Pseudomonadota bacterium]NIS69255.1 hypothetical protein [Pseudomonadota bacterium]